MADLASDWDKATPVSQEDWDKAAPVAEGPSPERPQPNFLFDPRLNQKVGEGAVPGFNKIVAAAKAALDPSDEHFEVLYQQHLRDLQSQSDETRRERPVASTLMGMGGAVATAPAVAAAAGPQAIGRAPSIVQGLKVGGVLGGAYGLGESRGETTGQILGDVAKGAVVGAAAGGGMGAALPGLPAQSNVGATTPNAQGLAEWLRARAGNRNIKAAGGIQSDITRARKQLGPGGANDGRAELQEIGAEMGEKGLVGPLSTPTKTFERSAALMDDAGGRMGNILDVADDVAGRSGGPTPSLSDVLSESMVPLAELKKNPTPSAQAAAARVEDFLGNIVSHAESDNVSFRAMHDLRRQIDKELFGLRGNKDPWRDAYSEALRQIRGTVSREIEAKLDAGTAQSPAWRAANRDYQVAAKALEFADKGIDRAVGNNLASLTEIMAGLTGASIGAQHAGLPGTLGGLAAVGGMALARRHGSGILGSAALGASNALRKLPSVSVPSPPAASPAISDPVIVELMDYLRRKQLGPVSAAADEEPNP